MNARRRLLHIISAFCLFLAGGCSLFRERPFSPEELKTPEGLELRDMTRVLEDRDRPLPELWAGGKIIFSGEPLKGDKLVNATLLYKKPNRLRIRLSRMITSTLFEFLASGNRVALIFNKDKTWLEGTLEELQSRSDVTMGINPVFLPRALLIQEELTEKLRSGAIDRIRREPEHLILADEDPAGASAYMMTRRELLVREAALYDPDGALLVRIRYQSYDVYDGVILPNRLEAYFPETGVAARVKISEYRVKPELRDAAFAMRPYPGFSRRPLWELWEGGPSGRP